MQTNQITLEHPAGRVRVRVPTDVRVDELMPDFLDVAAQPDHDDWTLGPADGAPYPPHLTFAELGVTDGSVLVLHATNGHGHDPVPAAAPPTVDEEQSPVAVEGEAPVSVQAAPPSDEEWAPAPLEAEVRAPVELNAPAAAPRLRSTHAEEAALRPVSARTNRTLPDRLSSTQRLASATRALLTRPPADREPQVPPTGVPDPALFALPVRVSRLTRLRQAWALGDYERRLEQLILAPHLRRCVTIAVVSPKGGVGKSTITALLGSLLAHLRRDRVVAVDTNPDWGSLGRRLVPQHSVFIDDLLAGPLKDGKLTPTQLDAQLGRGPDGLRVAPAPTDPDRASTLNRDDYATLFARLSQLVGTLVLDCGTGLGSAASRAAMACADQLVLVADGEPDTASLVAEAAQHLEEHAPPLVLAANKLDRRSLVDVDALERKVPFACGIAKIPTNKPGAQQLHASRFSWAQPPTGWAIPIRRLAALLAADWQRLDIAH
jgi:MinD-like ATPase involved in chromosome partitioning or flagellar assembly